MTPQERNARFGFTEECPNDEIRYKVVRKFHASTQTILLKRCLTLDEAKKYVSSFPKRRTSEVVMVEDV